MWVQVLTAWLVLAGCFGDDGPRRQPRRDRHLLDPGTPRLAPGAIPEGSPRVAPELADAPRLDELPEGRPGLVVLVVLDTVRADRLSVCGHDAPTSPNLAAFVARGAALTCRAYAPSTGTLPSLATVFTGLEPEEHGVLHRAAALPGDARTLAEDMVDRGYQTLLVSGNPALRRLPAVTRGFHGVRAGALAGERLVRALRFELAQIDPTRPLFVAVDVFEAHDPYEAVPEGVPWVAAQPAVAPSVEGPWGAFTAGTLAGAERDAFLGAVRHGYDHGVARADATFQAVVELLERHELGRHGVRLVVTSGHGESLGEHGLLLHGGPPWEPNARVPVLFLDSTRKDGQPKLPEPFPVSAVAALVATGEVPEPLPIPHTVAASGAGGVEDALAIWTSPTRKLLWRADVSAAYDLAADPGEVAPLSLTAEEAATLEAAVARWQATLATARATAAAAGEGEPPVARQPRGGRRRGGRGGR